jgi:hypothetical protein
MPLKVLFIHDKPDWLLLAILQECTHLDLEACVIGSVAYSGFGACREAFMPDELLERHPPSAARLARFRRAYRHLSVNPEAYERFCYERWFYIHAWLELNPELVVYLDSDYLPLPGFGLDKLPQGPMMDSPFVNVLRSREVFSQFLDYMTEVFENGEIDVFAERYTHFGKPHVSDMFVLREFSLANPERCLFVMTTLIEKGICPNVQVSNGHTESHGWRDIYRHPLTGNTFSQRLDGTLVPFYSLHFQGHSKKYAPRFMRESTMQAVFQGRTLWEMYRDRYGAPPVGLPGS